MTDGKFLGVGAVTYPGVGAVTYPGVGAVTYPGVGAVTYPGVGEPSWCPNPSKFIKNPSQIDQNDAQERSESDLGIKSVPGTVFWSTIGASGGAFCHHVVAAWVILGTILDTAGRQGYPKIEHFGTRKHQKSEK